MNRLLAAILTLAVAAPGQTGSKEQQLQQMREIAQQLRVLRADGLTATDSYEALEKQYAELSAAMGGDEPGQQAADEQPAVDGRARFRPLDLGLAPPAPVGCVVTTIRFENSTPVPIPTGPAVVSSTLQVTGAGSYISDVDVTTFITHTFAADLDITIQSPAGTVVTLTTDNGGGNDNVFNGTIWDDDANPGGQVPYATNDGLATDHAYVNLVPVSTLVPEEPLAAFIGEDPNGTWTITISDDIAADGGVLNRWELAIAALPSPPGMATTVASNNVAVAIPTGPAVVSSTINVAGAGVSIADVDATTFITHTFAADLDVTIQSPAGTVVTLTTDNGGGNDNVFNGTIWDDDANPGGQVPYTTNSGLATDHPYANLIAASTLAPEEALGAFIGEDPNGLWTITISDDAAADGGSLNSWSLAIATGTCGVPAAVDDAYATPFSTPLTVAAPGVLANDNGNGAGAMLATLVTNASNGSVALGSSGAFTYTPRAGFFGADSFTYRASNNAGLGNVATAHITVNPGAPTSANDDFSTAYLTTLALPAPGVLGNDSTNGGGALSAVLVSGVSNGTLALDPTGAVSYTPNFGFTGDDSFTYYAVNAVGPGNIVRVTIAVAAPTTVQPPFNLRVDSVSGNTVTLRWDALPIGPQASTFVLEGGLAPGDVLASIPTGSPAPIFTFVAPTGSFYIRMHGQLGADKSAASNEVPLHVNVPVPPSAPARLLGTASGDALALSWKNTFAGGPPTALIVDVTGAQTASLPIGPSDHFNFTPMPGGSYTFNLRAINAGGSSAPSNAVTLAFPAGCTGTPAAPTNLLAFRLGATAHVVWDPPTSGAAPTGYVLNVTGSYTGSIPTEGRALSGVVGPGTYNLSLSAANPCGTGPAAATVLVVP